MKVYSAYDVRKDATAWSKAPADVAAILGKIQNIVNKPYVTPSHNGFWSLQYARLKRFMLDIRLIFSLPIKSILILQLPGLFLSGGLGAFLIAALHFLRKIRIVVIVHDLECIRVNGLGCEPDAQLRAIIKWSSAIVAHNERMAAALKDFGASADKIVKLEVFDYLVEGNVPCIPRTLTKSVAIAGNLNADKARYLCHVSDIASVEWNLFGIGYDQSKINGQNIHYNGSFSPEELPKKMNQSFGLVWDGDSIETCSNRYGEYLRVNNPHKLSLYLASGMPVIIWNQAAEAEFVKKNKVGITVDSLRNLNALLDNMTAEQYADIVSNVAVVSKKLREGYYLTNAVKKAMNIANVVI